MLIHTKGVFEYIRYRQQDTKFNVFTIVCTHMKTLKKTYYNKTLSICKNVERLKVKLSSQHIPCQMGEEMTLCPTKLKRG